MTECPECKTKVENKDLIKEWNATPRAGPDKVHVTIHYWQCPNCGNRFRTATKIWRRLNIEELKRDLEEAKAAIKVMEALTEKSKEHLREWETNLNKLLGLKSQKKP